MINSKNIFAIACSIGLLTTADAQTEWDHPEDIPVIEPVTVGLAGKKPADIVRYLMARGAGQTGISPDGSKIAFSYRVTGEPQLWIVDADGGWPVASGAIRAIFFARSLHLLSTECIAAEARRVNRGGARILVGGVKRVDDSLRAQMRA